MNNFTGYGRSGEIDFGDYVQYPTGFSKDLHIFKVVGQYYSNTYILPPYTVDKQPEIQKEMASVLNIIHCGIDETKIITVKESDCIKMEVE